MNGTPTQSGSNEREELARLLPQPAERDLPGDRHRQLQEFVMNHIQQDLRPAARGPRRWPRRLAYLTSALAAGAAVAVATVAVGAGGLGSARTPAISADDGFTAEKLPEDTGAYWYVKVMSTDSRDGVSWQQENWTSRDGRTWFRYSQDKPSEAELASPSAFPDTDWHGKVIEQAQPDPFRLGEAEVTIEQIQALPTEPAALKASIAKLVRNSDIRTSTGRPTAAQQRRFVFEGLVSLISLLPAPPKVRAAALRAIASYPNVTSLGAVDGGRGLLISFHPGEPPARLVIDPTTGQLRRTNVLIMPFGGAMTSDGGTYAITAEWTNTLPR